MSGEPMTTLSLRVPRKLLSTIDSAAKNIGSTRTALMLQWAMKDAGAIIEDQADAQIATITRERDELKRDVENLLAKETERLNTKCFECNGALNGPYCPKCASLEEGQLQSATLTGIRAGLEEAAKIAFNGNGMDPADCAHNIARIIRSLNPQSILDKLTKTEGAK